MNPRERNLLIVLVAILGTAGAVYGSITWFVVPLKDYNAKIRQLSDDNDTLHEKMALFTRERKKIDIARLKSLPAKPQEAVADYDQYLKKILSDSNLTLESLNHTKEQDVKLPVPIPNVKKTGHQFMGFMVQAKGELSQLITALEMMQRTPYEHRFKSLIVQRNKPGFGQTSDNSLSITMNIEVLMVAGTQNRAGMTPTIDGRAIASLQMPVSREYANMKTRNIFIGAEDLIVKKKKAGPDEVIVKWVEEDPPPISIARPGFDVTKYLKMTTTVPDKNEVYFINHGSQSEEVKLTAQKKGYDTFRVLDENGKYEFCNFKVLRVDLHEIYVQVKDEVFVMQFRQSLYEATQTPIKDKQLFWVGVKIDTAWGTEEKKKQVNLPPKKGFPMRPRS
jgi:hypothetical protein